MRNVKLGSLPLGTVGVLEKLCAICHFHHLQHKQAIWSELHVTTCTQACGGNQEWLALMKGLCCVYLKESYLYKISELYLEFFFLGITHTALSLWIFKHFTECFGHYCHSSFTVGGAKDKVVILCQSLGMNSCCDSRSFRPQPRSSLFAALMFWHWGQVFSYLEVQCIISLHSVVSFRVLFCFSKPLNLTRTRYRLQDAVMLLQEPLICLKSGICWSCYWWVSWRQLHQHLHSDCFW